MERFIANAKHEGKELTKEEVMKGRSSAYEFIDFDKTETLEEAAERYADESFIPMKNSEGEPLRIPVGQSVPCGFTKHKKVATKHFTNGAKWQQEHILDFLYSEITERRDYSASKMCEKVIEFIKQI